MSARPASAGLSSRVALTAFVLACALVAWTLVRALRTAPLPNAVATTPVSMEPMTRRPLSPPTDVQAAVESDLFSPDRTAPDTPYRMPGESDGSDKPAVDPMKPAVLGTVVSTDGRSFASVRLGDASPQLVHVGDKIGEWVVKSITRGTVVILSANGTRAELTVPKPGT
jgi:hypothetical protein